MGGSGLPAQASATSASLDDIRQRRLALQAEAARAAYWKRLVQARLDLVVASAAPVDDLVGDAVPGLFCLVQELRPLVQDDSTDLVTMLQDLDRVRRWLGAYADAVSRAAEEAGRELVEHYAQEPASCLAAPPVPGPAAEVR